MRSVVLSADIETYRFVLVMLSLALLFAIGIIAVLIFALCRPVREMDRDEPILTPAIPSKGGRNTWPSQIKERPPAPAPSNVRSTIKAVRPPPPPIDHGYPIG